MSCYSFHLVVITGTGRGELSQQDFAARRFPVWRAPKTENIQQLSCDKVSGKTGVRQVFGTVCPGIILESGLKTGFGSDNWPIDYASYFLLLPISTELNGLNWGQSPFGRDGGRWHSSAAAPMGVWDGIRKCDRVRTLNLPPSLSQHSCCVPGMITVK